MCLVLRLINSQISLKTVLYNNGAFYALGLTHIYKSIYIYKFVTYNWPIKHKKIVISLIIINFQLELKLTLLS